MHGNDLFWGWVQQLFRDARVPEGCHGLLSDKLLPDCPSTIWNSTGTVWFSRVSGTVALNANKMFQSRTFPDISANGANYVVVYVINLVL